MSTYVVGDDQATLDEKKNVVRLLKAFVISNRLSCRKQEKTPGKPGFGELEELLTNTESMTLREREKNYPMSILQVKTHTHTQNDPESDPWLFLVLHSFLLLLCSSLSQLA